MSVALQPTEVVKKVNYYLIRTKEFQSDMQPYRFVDESIHSSAEDSNFFILRPPSGSPIFLLRVTTRETNHVMKSL